MTNKLRWRRAAGFSCVFHLVFFILLGWFAAPLFEAPVTAEELIELELADPGGDHELEAGAPAAPSASPQDSVQMKAPQVVQSHTPQVVAVAEPMTLMSAEVPADIVENSGGTGSAPGEGGANGSGNGSGADTGGSGGGSGQGNDAGTGRKGILHPRVLSKVEPVYPPSARNAGQEGTVVLKIQIMENGRPGDIVVYRSSGYDSLDDAAVAAVKKWRFTPAKDRESGRTFTCTTSLPVVFQLKN
jgi:protein TonB